MFMNEVVDNTNDSATSNRQKDAVNNCGAAAIAAAAGLFEAEAATGCLSVSTLASLCMSFLVMFTILACEPPPRAYTHPRETTISCKH